MKTIETGIRQKIAIEGVFQSLAPMFGNIWIWINNYKLGVESENDYEYCFPTFGSLKWIANGIESRSKLAFDDKSKKEIFELLTNFETFSRYVQSINLTIVEDALSTLFDDYKLMCVAEFDHYIIRSYTQNDTVFFLWKRVGNDELLYGEVKVEFLKNSIIEFVKQIG
jgi:hypothetical protein